MRYPSLTVCGELIFPYIRNRMASTEPAPMYERERRGMNGLDSLLTLMQHDNYADLLSKASYLFCSIIDGHHFSNGNKRLAVALVVFFLLVNEAKIHAPNMDVIHRELRKTFPNIRWQNVGAFQQPHEYFFYHLALVIADRTQKGKMSFRREQEAVRTLFAQIVIAPPAGPF